MVFVFVVVLLFFFSKLRWFWISGLFNGCQILQRVRNFCQGIQPAAALH